MRFRRFFAAKFLPFPRVDKKQISQLGISTIKNYTHILYDELRKK